MHQGNTDGGKLQILSEGVYIVEKIGTQKMCTRTRPHDVAHNCTK